MKKKILKKTLAVLLLLVVLVTAIVVPCFAWEWNSSYQKYYATPVASVNYSGLGSTPFGASGTTGNWFTTNGQMNFLWNTNANPDSYETITQFPLDSNGNIAPQGSTSQNLACVSLETAFPNEEDIKPRLYEALSKYQYTFDRYGKYIQFDNATDLCFIRYMENVTTSTDRDYYWANRFDDFMTFEDFLSYCATYQFYTNRYGQLPEETIKAPASEFFECYGSVTIRMLDGTQTVLHIGDIMEEEELYYFANGNLLGINLPLTSLIKNAVTSVEGRDPDYPILIRGLTVSTRDPITHAFQYRLAGVYYNDINETILRDAHAQSSALNPFPFGAEPVVTPDIEGLDSVTDFLNTALGGFLSFSIIPGITLGGILATVLCIALFLVFLKVFAGG